MEQPTATSRRDLDVDRRQIGLAVAVLGQCEVVVESGAGVRVEDEVVVILHRVERDQGVAFACNVQIEKLKS